jgi:GT2 family glycosyltransferase
MDTPSLVVAIVNYRTPDLTIGSLRSLVDEVKATPTIRVVVADNCSGDGSVDRIDGAIKENGWSSWASLLALPRNGGFSYGNNACFRLFLKEEPKPDYFLLLNPDTVVRSGAIAVLLQFMASHPEVGIAGSRLEDPDGKSQISAFRFHSILGEFNNQMRLGVFARLLGSWVRDPPITDASVRADWVAGASMMVRRAVFEQVGLFDEGYFLYFEEVDFCLRVFRAGFSCWYVPSSRVVHLVGQSTGVTNPSSRRNRLPKYWFDSRRRYFLKNHGPLYTTVVDCVWLVGHLLWQVRRFLQRKPQTGPASLLVDYARNTVFARGYRL